jgi:hypothetical protein
MSLFRRTVTDYWASLSQMLLGRAMKADIQMRRLRRRLGRRLVKVYIGNGLLLQRWAWNTVPDIMLDSSLKGGEKRMVESKRALNRFKLWLGGKGSSLLRKWAENRGLNGCSVKGGEGRMVESNRAPNRFKLLPVGRRRGRLRRWPCCVISKKSSSSGLTESVLSLPLGSNALCFIRVFGGTGSGRLRRRKTLGS